MIQGLKDMCWVIQSMATRNEMGAKMQPCLTPEVVEILGDSFCLTLIRAPVFSWRAVIWWSMMSGMPLLWSPFQRAVWSTELKADLMSMNVTFSCRLNSRCSSDRRCRARMASVVDLPAVSLMLRTRLIDKRLCACQQNVSEYVVKILLIAHSVTMKCI